MGHGFWTKYFSTILKGISALALKEKIEARRIVHKLKKSDKILYKKLVQDVEGDHRVSAAIKEETALLRNLGTSLNNAYSILFNISVEDLELIKIIEKILHELGELSKSLGGLRYNLPKEDNFKVNKLIKQLAANTLGALKKGEKANRKEYRQVMLIIAEAEEKDHEKFMANIRLAFQQEKSQSILANFVIRGQIRRAKYDIVALRRIPGKIRKIKDDFAKRGKDEKIDKILRDLSATIKEVKDHCWDAFYEMYEIIKRVMLFTLKALLDLNTLKEFNNKWIDEHFMPTAQTRQKNAKIDEIESHLAQEFHTIAQAFRVVIHGIMKEERTAENLAR